MNTYWTSLCVGWLVLFAIGETWAIQHKTVTLSQWVWQLSQDWPLFGPVLGLVVGGLFVHFYWHWMPPGSTPNGG